MNLTQISSDLNSLDLKSQFNSKRNFGSSAKGFSCIVQQRLEFCGTLVQHPGKHNLENDAKEHGAGEALGAFKAWQFFESH